MTQTIEAGDIFVNEDGLLPNLTVLQRKPHSSGWAAVSNARSTFEKEIPAAGWTFFFMAGEMKTTVFGFNREKATSTALGRLIANVKAQDYNSIEILQVTASSFLKVPYVSVSAHARHLQMGSTFGQR